MIRKRLLIGTLCGSMLALAVPACGSQDTPPTVGRITFEVSGGFAGMDRILTVEPDGTARITVVAGPSPAASPTVYHVEPAVLERLHQIVSGQDFAALAPSYLPSPGGADLQDYTVTVEIGSRTLKTATRDGATRPPVLDEVMTILSSIMSAAAAPAGASSS